jgi:hypothetical protein
MPAANTPHLPARFIVLDLVSTLLILAGVLDVANAQLLGPLSRLTAVHGWTLVIFGALSMSVAGMLPVTQARQRANNSGLSPEPRSQTAQCRAY